MPESPTRHLQGEAWVRVLSETSPGDSGMRGARVETAALDHTVSVASLLPVDEAVATCTCSHGALGCALGRGLGSTV